MSNPTRFPPITSWLLWRRLLHPVVDPVFARALRTRRASYPISVIAWGTLLFSLMTCCCLFQFLFEVSGGLIIMLLIVIIAASTFYVAAWILQITAALARERNRSTYDLFCVTPPGALGITLAICAAYLHSNDALGWIDAARKVLTGMILFALAVYVITSLRESASTPLALVRLMLDIGIVAAVSYADHVQSIVLGSLIAMLAPTYVRGGLDARILALFVFLVLQVIACVSIVLIVIVSDASDLVVVSLVLLCALREAVIIALWRRLTFRLNATPLELTVK